MEQTLIIPQRRISLFVQACGFIFFSILFYFCWRFYMERILSFDGAFYVFQFMESGRFTCSPGRYGDYIAQLLPLLAYKMDFPLHTILIIYSVSFILFHYAIFLFVTLYLRNNGAGIAIMLASCLAYYYAFYLPTLELHESIVLGVLLWAIIHPEQQYITAMQKNIAMAGAIATIFFMSYFHPLGIFIVVFVMGIELIGAKRIKDWRLWATALVGLGWYVVRFYVISKQSYDQEQLIPFHEMVSNLSGWKAWPSTHYLSDHLWLHFRSLKWLGILLIVLSLRKGILTFLFALVFIAGYTFIFLSNYRHGASIMVYESYFIAYGFFVGLLFVFLIYHPSRKNLAMLLAIPLLFMGLKKIYQAHDTFTYRLAYLNRIINAAHKEGGHKYIIDSKCYPDDYAWSSWNVAFETLIYSSLEGRDSSVTVFIKTPEFSKLCDTNKDKHNILLGAQFSPLWYTSNDMPEDYMKLPSTGYDYLTHSQDDTAFHENVFNAGNVKITPLVQSVNVLSHEWHTVIPIEITNTSGKMIPAIPRTTNPVCLAYKLYDASGKVVRENENQALETDIHKGSEQGLIVYYPMTKGVYYLQPDLVTVGKRSWNLPVQRIKVTVE